MFNIINKEMWVRKEHFMHFSKYARNSFNLTKEIDVTSVLEIKKQRGFSFYGIMLYLLTQTVNEMPELRMACQNGEVGYWDNVHPSYTILNSLTKTFINIWTPFQEDLECFVKDIEKDILEYKEQTRLFPQKSQAENTVSISCLPWLEYDSFSIELENQEFYSPIITFSKYVVKDSQVTLKVSIRCNHAVTDGYHASLFFKKLEKNIAELGEVGGAICQLK